MLPISFMSRQFLRSNLWVQVHDVTIFFFLLFLTIEEVLLLATEKMQMELAETHSHVFL